MDVQGMGKIWKTRSGTMNMWALTKYENKENGLFDRKYVSWKQHKSKNNKK